ncbi:MAG: hypothetical protein M3Y51_07825 [Actinomycetota bacterium]|nr:hypothetical protein [Actinomycetota bacterium]
MDGSLMATFTRREAAGGAATRLRDAHPDLDVTVGDEEDALDALAINQRAELDDAAVVGPSAMWSGPMMRGGVLGAVIGFVVGAILILPILLLVDWPEDNELMFVIIVAIIGGLATSAVTFLVGMVRRAQREGEFTPEDPWAVVRIRPEHGAAWNDDLVDTVEAELAEAGARSIRRVTAPVARRSGDDVETPRVSTERAPVDDWPASQPGARSESA